MSNDEKLALEKRAPQLLAAIEKKNTEVAAKISHAYAEASRSLSNALGHTICAGLMILQRKEELPHGEFGPWLEKFCPEISWVTACAMMNATRGAVARVLGDENAKPEILSNLKFDGAPLPDVLSADPATLTKSAREVQNQFKDFLQGKTQHQLLLDWKEIKAKGDDDRTPAKKPTAAELAEAESQSANDNLTQLAADIELFVLQGKALQCASDSVKQALLEKGIEMNNRLRDALTAGKAKGKGRKP